MIGLLTGVTVNLACRVKGYIGYDDALDAFGFHGVGGLLGTILTAFLHQKRIDLLDGASSPGGAIDGNWISIWYQLVEILAIATWAYGMTLLICFIIDHIPGLKLGISAEKEFLGADLEQMGETVFYILI